MFPGTDPRRPRDRSPAGSGRPAAGAGTPDKAPRYRRRHAVEPRSSGASRRLLQITIFYILCALPSSTPIMSTIAGLLPNGIGLLLHLIPGARMIRDFSL